MNFTDHKDPKDHQTCFDNPPRIDLTNLDISNFSVNPNEDNVLLISDSYGHNN